MTEHAATPNALTRRNFLETAAVGSAVTAWHVNTASAGTSDGDRKVTIGVMGLSRGRSLAQTFAKQANVEVKYLCDVDKSRATSVQALIGDMDGQSPTAIADFRRILDDPAVDALICAAPNHWHGPATILGCQAGKHVYVEKPCSHNPQEGEMMVAASRKHKKAVQMGTQRRSAPGTIAGVKAIHEGKIGRALYARSWYANTRGSIGKGKTVPVPTKLDFDLWQGPAPKIDYVDNLVHYNWHWRWDWGNGELGNNGVHALDLCRWALDVDYPVRVTSSGGRYFFEDDQQTPDTHCVNYEFADGRQIMWEGLSCNRMGINGSGFGVTIHGETGTIALTEGGYIHYDKQGKEVNKVSGSRGDSEHVANFLNAIRTDDPTSCNQDIVSGHRSTLLCHLGNISHRVGRVLHCDPVNGHIQKDEPAHALWSREYNPAWKPQV